MAAKATLKRMMTYAWLSFRRNGWLSTATILVKMLTLFVIGGLILVSVIANTVLNDLENKIDISMSFTRGTPEDQILAIKREVETLQTVKEINYVSPEEALANFKERHKDDAVILASLEELGDENPLPATLNIKAQAPDQLAAIAKFLTDQQYPSVEKINYFENQKVIDRLSAVVRGVRSTGVLAVLVLAFVAVLVAFNTVRLAIYTSREEINIMKLVGATNWYIRGPFMIEGLLHGGIAAVITAFIFFPLLWVMSPRISVFLPSVNLLAYFSKNFLEFFLILFVIGITLGVGSSFLAVRRYLKI
ncbi:MAG: ABC transporter permease [Candidatus Sungbacteria bacterium]|uniref:Cell division protein FtsX n=1 Tax=Candidatus Sungiibacteriota bacterium TaxID=2750080 RepID=A0A932YWP6_9BACT|nr:ABC transporter permease [Candidatus Sungbacteria bacterium]